MALTDDRVERLKKLLAEADASEVTRSTLPDAPVPTGECRMKMLIIGAGGFGREVVAFAPETYECVFSQPEEPPGRRINGTSWMSLEEFYALSGDKAFTIAIADSRARQRIAQEAEQHCRPETIIASSALVGPDNNIGHGAIICPFSSITTNASIGRFFHSNIYSYVGHDCVIGDFVTFAPRVCCNGRVHIGDHAYIGTGAKLKEGTLSRPLRIGRGAVVGMGAVVLNDVPDGATVVGVPARIVSQPMTDIRETSAA